MSQVHNVFRPILVCIALMGTASSQTLVEFNSGNTAHIRGLSAVSDRVIWVSGTNGQVGRTDDGGQTWIWKQIPGFEKVDFRDIEAFDDHTAVIMGVGSPGYILHTADAGKNWTVVYKNVDSRIFLDAMMFWNDRSGIIIGDPMDGRFFILRSFDGGRNWRELPIENRPTATEGEACFAASGSNLARVSKDEAVFVSGGMRSRFFRRDSSKVLPIIKGSESTGANAIASYQNCGKGEAMHLVVVGGDFSNDKKDSAVCAISSDGGKTWKQPERAPLGYRSGVVWINRAKLLACGTSGVDVSEDGGMRWRPISQLGFHVCAKSKKGSSVFLAGPKGRIARLDW
ncbi:MAG: YCF48-related protein [Bacteroidota bacterium]